MELLRKQAEQQVQISQAMMILMQKLVKQYWIQILAWTEK